MIILYQLATSPFSDKVRRALAYKNLPFEIHEVDRAAAAAGTYRHVSAIGKFPAIDHGGHCVQDSTDIIEYLDEKFPGRPLLPANHRDRGLAHAIEEWADESLYFYEMTIRLTWEHNLERGLDEFAQSMPGLPRDQLRKMIIDGVTALTSAQGVGRKSRETVIRDVERHMAALDAMLHGRDWLVGDALSVADLAVIAQLHALLFADEACEALDCTGRVKAWMARVDEIAPR
jgi:glutathione S-transferase